MSLEHYCNIILHSESVFIIFYFFIFSVSIYLHSLLFVYISIILKFVNNQYEKISIILLITYSGNQIKFLSLIFNINDKKFTLFIINQYNPKLNI